MRAGLGIVLAATMAFGCYTGAEVDGGDGGAAQDGGSDMVGSAGQAGGSGSAGVTGRAGSGGGRPSGGTGGEKEAGGEGGTGLCTSGFKPPVGEQCSADSDCGNPYLACVESSVFIYETSDAAAADAALDGSWGRTTVQTTLKICQPTYQQPCLVDTDCGLAGFKCNLDAGMSCSSSGCKAVSRCDYDYVLCSSEADCPEGWSCCSPDGVNAKACYPPFVIFLGR